jgi:ubiquinone/menaquinone biosynthesis C-methylase UbiE
MHSMSQRTEDKYIPALGHDRLTPLYDALVGTLMREKILKAALIRQARILPGHRVLDLGCGTATLTLMLKQAEPEAEVVGLDGDEQVLAIARTKVARAGVDIRFDQGMAYALPYPDASFDRVVSSLVIHHLTSGNKQRAFQEAFRILRPEGELHILDFGPPRHLWARLLSPLMGVFEEAGDNVSGRLPVMMRSAGFERVETPADYGVVFGTLSLYRAVKPSA